jgi:hypothetical protein
MVLTGRDVICFSHLLPKKSIRQESWLACERFATIIFPIANLHTSFALEFVRFHMLFALLTPGLSRIL